MARVWTKQQKTAIDTRDRTLLVSAAAGSGKTATLTERIIQSILDEENPADIGSMLIATFTNAAVDELRERIGAAIKAAAVENPSNAHLEEQLLRIKDAKILTISSFCNTVLRSCADSVGLPPNYRIAEPAEAAILFSEICEGLIEAAYADKIPEVCSAEDFISLTDCLAGIKTESGLSEVIKKVFEGLTSTEAGIDTLVPLIEEYNPVKFTEIENTRFGKYVIAYAKNAAEAYTVAYRKTLAIAGAEKIDQRNLPKAESDLAAAEKILSLDSYAEIKAAIDSVTFKNLSRSQGEELTDFYVRVGALCSHFKADIALLKNKFFNYTREEWLDLYTKLYKLSTTFYKFIKKFYELFKEEKLRHGICEFSDIERYTYEALYREDGSTTPLAGELRDKFTSVYVDEYQDVNGLQSKIFTAISKENNRFMVGDIKQSIYGFRAARPEIFAEMKSRFPELSHDGDYPYASLFMSQNFRCDRNVVDFVNGIFDTMFGLLGESIGYAPGDRLEFAKIYPNGSAPTNHVPEIHLVEKVSAKSAPAPEDLARAMIYDEFKNFGVMAEHVAVKIEELISEGRLANGECIQPKDICIMLRSTKTKGERMAAVLKRHGISSSVEDSGDLFMNEEVLLALSFLYSIDNPERDVYLVALMCSPLFGFTPDEILKIRKSSDEETVYRALLSYIKENPTYEKGVRFVSDLMRYRRLSEGKSTDALISLIYRESGLFALASKNGGAENLTLLHSYARKYEESSFKGLYSFLSYISEVIAGNQKFSSAATEEEENSVKIITIHKSKGLEFPVCFLADATSGGTGSDSKKILFSDSFGIAFKPKDDTGLALVENPACHVVDHYIKSKEFEEELRVLYVALTRARERLYIYGTSPRAGYTDYTDTMREILSPFFAKKASSLMDIILISRSCGKLFIDPPFDTGEDEDGLDILFGEKEERGGTAENAPEPGALTEEELILSERLLERFLFKNPLSHLETLPEKVSVSRLSPNVLDGTEESDSELADIFSSGELILYDSERAEDLAEATDTQRRDEDGALPERAPTLPSFITGTMERESAKRGIATHMVLQFCDFDKLEALGARAELERLKAEEFISEEDAERVRLGELERFIKSPLFEEMKSAKKLYREFRFNTKLPAEDFTEDEEKKKLLRGEYILVQGVIDCVIERADGTLHLIDYKTDRLNAEERKHPELADARMRRAHSLQLSYYSSAVELIFGKRPSRVGVYSLHAGREIDII